MSGYRARYADCEPVVASVTPAWYLMPNGTCIGVEVVRYDKGCKTDIFRLGTCTKLSPFDPARLSYDNPCAAAEFEWPEGGPFFVNKYDAAGEPTVGPIDLRNTLGAELPEDITAGSYIVYNTVDAEGNITGADVEAIRQSPTGLSIPQRSETGQIRAQNPLAPFDVVNLRYLQTALAELDPFPEGTQYQVITYDENNAPVADYLSLMSLTDQMPGFLENIPDGSMVGWATLISGPDLVNFPAVYNHSPAPGSPNVQVPHRLSVGDGGTQYLTLQTETAPDGVVGGALNDQMVVNKAYLKSKIGGGIRDVVSSGNDIISLTTAGANPHPNPQICVDLINEHPDLPMIGLVQFVASGGARRVGDGDANTMLEWSFDGGATWVGGPHELTRTGFTGMITSEHISNSQWRGVTVPPATTVTLCARFAIDVVTPYEAGSSYNGSYAIRYMAVTEYEAS